jgi:hypothetical protein
MYVPIWKITDERSPVLLAGVSTLALAAGLATIDPLAGLLFVAVPTGFASLVRHRGLGGIPTVVFVAAIAASMIPPGLFLDDYRTGSERPAIGLVIILVWVLAYPGMVGQLDRQYLREHFSFPDGSVPSEPLAELRVRTIALGLTVTTMLVVGELLAAAVVAFALVHRRRWTAVCSVLACLTLPLVGLDPRPVVVLAGLVAAHQWIAAIGDPAWTDARDRDPGVAARSRSVAGGGAGPASPGVLSRAVRRVARFSPQ